MKVSPYDFRNMPQEVIDFKEEVSNILNFSRYQAKVLVAATPTWTGEEGEVVYCYYVSAVTGYYDLYTYLYANSGWRVSVFSALT